MEDSVKKDAIKGVGWNFLDRFVIQGAQLVITFILVRILSPDDFGIVAMIFVFCGIGNIIVDSGFKAFIIQEPEISNDQLSSIFWFNLLVGVLLTIIFIGAANSIANFYNYPELSQVVYITSPIFILSGIQLVPDSIFSKELKFNVLAKRNIIANFLSGGLAIISALIGFGFWSIIIQRISKLTFSNILIWRKLKWRPGFHFSVPYIKKAFIFSSSIMTNGLLGYAIDNLDNILIGKYFGKAPLGMYSKSYSIINLAPNNIRSVINKTVLPVMAKVKDDATISKLLFTTMKYILIVSLPIMVIVSLNAENFTLLFFGEKWIDQTPLVRLFAIGGIFLSINNLFLSVLIVKKKTKEIYQSTLIRRGIVLGGLIIAFPFGLEAIAFGRVVAEFLNLIVCFIYIKIALKTSLREQIFEIAPYFISSAFVGFLLTYFFHQNIFQALLLKLMFNALIFFVLYYIVLFLFFPVERATHKQLIERVSKFIPKKGLK